jgi:hypothetical protein
LSEPASLYGFKTLASLSMSLSPNWYGPKLHRIVLGARLGRIEQQTKDLRVSLGSPASKAVKQCKHHQSTQKGVQQVEDRGSHHHREEEQLPLGSHQSERRIQGAKHGIESALHHGDKLLAYISGV